ncbi:MAG: ATP-dependent DNA helicase [Acidobacteria bacterium]|nr:ATP-dependent DNA helicase [Acidobacteriota bacterium]
MAEAIARTFDDGGTLLVEAGTGTGKTLAYLVPAVLAGRRVLISTGTRTLQDQIFYKDIPALSQAMDREVRAAYMKGRTNYLCLHRFDRLREAEAALPDEERRWVNMIAEWTTHTNTGDRAEIEDLPDDFMLWSDMTANGDQCLGRECPRFADCYVTRMRERAAESDIVIVNHHLLCADAAVREGAFGEVIPECDLLVIDEAHQLEDVVTHYFGVALTGHRLDELDRDAGQALAGLPPGDGLFAAQARHAIDEVVHAGRRLFDAARLLLRARSESGDRMMLTPALAEQLLEPGLAFQSAAENAETMLRHREELPEDLASIGARLSSARADIAVLLGADDSRFVHYIEARGRSVSLRAAPIDVADLVRDTVIGTRKAAVLTSATLTVAGSFDYMMGRLGTRDAQTLRLPSEFDFTKQAVLFLPSEMPDPRSPEFNRSAAWHVSEILERTEGRAFVLFTSYAAMRDVHAVVSTRINWPILMQGSAPRSALLRDFRSTPNAVLFATASFWQGVDVAGDTLSCVIIDRLPFASPGDPLVKARIDAIDQRGGNAFQDYQIPLATLTLLQGLGRLIRTRTDRGVLAILDPRLTRMGYGRRFLASLPPAPITSDLEAIRRFLLN